MIGTRLAHYEITNHLGTGGMGEVYQATDSKLGRSVAIKLLPAGFASDPDRLARFRREAQLLASLNHPNIAHIYGLEEMGEFGETRCIVMELVAGESLQARLKRGPLPVDEALTIAKQIAEAMESAHEKGVIHRDLKPGNVMLAADGKVKVLDFGLARAYDANPSNASLSNSPTMASMAATNAGIILGTAAYMSPEQARGKPVDKRADIWAFGCLLYEMLTGKQLFGGETISDSLAKVLERAPDWNELADSHRGLRTLLRRCLEKNPSRRLRDFGDVFIELEDITSNAPPDAVIASAVPQHRNRVWFFATVALLGVSIAFAVLYVRSRPASLEAMYLSIAAPEGETFSGGTYSSAVISPDGSYIAFLTGPVESSKLWVRSLHSADARVIEGSDRASGTPFWSPDSRWVGFFANTKLLKADVRGGKAEVISTLDARGVGRASGTWNRNGTILFGLDSGRPISQVSMEGGAVTPATTLDASREDNGHFRPQFLPDGRHFLFLIQSRRVGGSGIYAGSLDSKDLTPILPGFYTPAYYVPSGQILFVRNSALFAQNFDLDKLAVQDKPIRIADSIFFVDGNAAFATFSASDSGILVYRTGDFQLSFQSQLQWFDRHGSGLGSIGPIGQIRNPRLSPDGGRAAVEIGGDSGSFDIWVLGTASSSSRVAADSQYPVWSSDGARLLYLRRREGGKSSIVKKLVSGEGGDEEELKIQSSWIGHIDDWSPDEKYVVHSFVQDQTNRDIEAISVGPDPNSIPVAVTVADELYGRISPDGHWIAYESIENGKQEIYLQAFPRAGSKILVSQNGGRWPVWRRDGKELFYISTDGKKLWAVNISGGSTLQPGTPEALFDVRLTGASGIGSPSKYDVTRDGQKFLIDVALGEAPEISPIHVILNWTELLKR